MPLVVLTGYPCSGLSYRAKQLAELFEKAQDEFFASSPETSRVRYKIHIVASHDSSSYPRTVYDNARTEKEARGVASSRAKRALGRDSIVILDGMNYIKGFRYQLWCDAKALGTASCTVHVGTPVDQCVANNEARLQRDQRSKEADETCTSEQKDLEPAYPPELLNNLIFRYEEPSMHSRWDKPLFTVPWADAEPPVGDIWTALTGLPLSSTPLGPADENSLVSKLTSSLASSTLTSDTASTTTTTAARRPGLSRPKIKPHVSTALPAAINSDTLYSYEKRTSAIVAAIRSFTQAHPSAEAALAQSSDGSRITIPVSEASEPVVVPAHVAMSTPTDDLAGAGGVLALPRLQRLRRQWIGLNRAYIGQAGKSNYALDQVGDAFVRFLNAEIDTTHT
ncbi:hypothetical protein ASPZODRAFT_144932 [Penicilliopsis zonata CBS 506.65]|uniref:Chromatin associated protein KTI12 n=1 Tax=Penicilliopsis zonata CBS 506.65 TaxID=1073090 RepID=A0A1L9SB57_9EURO|nr:hypothetical protein ASPZODRAFT_144932 [Penicilliopsis zonata CBS 506.65]OJJ44357.1 hypothetical protein ASPZODRAFT_144932 [Penicilliopsis zonata CBS 506.65]